MMFDVAFSVSFQPFKLLPCSDPWQVVQAVLLEDLKSHSKSHQVTTFQYVSRFTFMSFHVISAFMTLEGPIGLVVFRQGCLFYTHTC